MAGDAIAAAADWAWKQPGVQASIDVHDGVDAVETVAAAMAVGPAVGEEAAAAANAAIK